MPPTVTIVLLGIVGALVGALVVHYIEARLPVVGRRIVVNLTDGSAMRGVLTAQRGPWLVLHDADVLRVDNGGVTGTVRIDGAVYVERPRITFVQVLP
jgi:hypothetical protein